MCLFKLFAVEQENQNVVWWAILYETWFRVIAAIVMEYN